MTIDQIVFIFASAFDVYIISMFLKVLYEKKRISILWESVLLISYFIGSILLFFLVSIPIVNLIWSLSIFFILSYIYRSTLLKRVLNSLLILSVMVMVEMIVYFGILQINLKEIQASYDLEIIVIYVAVRVITLMVVRLFDKFKLVKKGEKLPIHLWLALVLIPLGSLVSGVLLFMFVQSQTSIIFSTLFMFFINAFVFFLYDRQQDIYVSMIDRQILIEQNTAYQTQLKIMDESMLNIRTVKHDMTNHFNTMQSLIDESKTDELKEYLLTTTSMLSQKEFHTGNTAIDSILNYKNEISKLEGITLDVSIDIPNKIGVSNFDISTILGNIIDNAIEAVKQTEQKYIQLSIKLDKGILYIVQSNHFDKEYEKKKKRSQRGLGLKNVSRIIDKYDGLIETETEASIFITRLMIYTNKEE